MRTHHHAHRARIAIGVGTAVLALVASTVPAAEAVLPAPQHARKVKPTVVLVHGAWADSSSWAGVVGLLQDDGYQVVVIANPLHGLASDAAYLKGYLATIPGPIVLVGHSYGGAVVTNAATGNANVKALVYVDAFAPDQGESVVQLATAKPGSALAADPATVFSFAPFPGSQPGDVELTVLPKVFRKAFANDLPRAEGKVLAATQRPVAGSALQEPSAAPAWKTIPSWYLAGRVDGVLPIAEQKAMAHRAGSHLTKIKAGHLPMVSQPDAVEEVILDAATSTD